MSDQVLVTYDARDGAAYVTLDSPHNRNAIASVLVTQLLAAPERAESARAARVGVLARTGRPFCAGADLAEARSASGSAEEQAAARTRVFLDPLRAVISHAKPVSAGVDGHIRAGGMGPVASC